VKGTVMDDRELWHQAMLERQQHCEEALERAKAGVATAEDWSVIYFECGIRERKENELSCEK
jgi:hypothetical protein